MNITPQIVIAILKFKKACNLIGGFCSFLHFGQQLENQTFPRHAVLANYSQL